MKKVIEVLILIVVEDGLVQIDFIDAANGFVQS